TAVPTGSIESKTGAGEVVAADAEFQAPGSVPPSGASPPDRCAGSDSRRDPGCWMDCASVQWLQASRRGSKPRSVYPATRTCRRKRRLGRRTSLSRGDVAVDPANFKRRVELGLTWGTRIRTGAGCKNFGSVSGIDAAGISPGIVGRASVRLMAAPPHVRSILKLRLEQESGSALQDPRHGNRAELCVRLDPF